MLEAAIGPAVAVGWRTRPAGDRPAGHEFSIRHVEEAHVEMPPSSSDDSQVKVASGLAFLAGVWVVISAWVFGATYTSGSALNSIIVGVVIAVLAAIRFLSPRSAVGLSWINALFGIWMIISPWIYGYAATNTARTWNSVIFGIIVLILSVWSAAATRGAAPVG